MQFTVKETPEDYHAYEQMLKSISDQWNENWNNNEM